MAKRPEKNPGNDTEGPSEPAKKSRAAGAGPAAERRSRSRAPRARSGEGEPLDRTASEASDTFAPPVTAEDVPAGAGHPAPQAHDAPMAEAVAPEAAEESAPLSSDPSESDIRARAYQRYLERGGSDGGDFDDWVAAERELRKDRT